MSGIKVEKEPGNTFTVTGPTHMDSLRLTPAEARELYERLGEVLGVLTYEDGLEDGRYAAEKDSK